MEAFSVWWLLSFRLICDKLYHQITNLSQYPTRDKMEINEQTEMATVKGTIRVFNTTLKTMWAN